MRGALLLLIVAAITTTKTSSYSPNPITRRKLLIHGSSFVTSGYIAPLLTQEGGFVPKARAIFDGGVGGLGKTKPETGVVLRPGWVPSQDSQGTIAAEIESSRGNPIFVQFTSPWPMLTTAAGLEARDLQQPESSFVQVIRDVPDTTTGKALNKVLTDGIFGSKGKYGAYGTPTDIRIKPRPDKPGQFDATFVALTPAMRESERRVILHTKFADTDTLVVLVTGTTMPRFRSQEKTIAKVSDSFDAFNAPQEWGR